MGSDREIGYEIRVLNNTIRNSINSMKLNKAIESNPHTTRLHAWVIGFVFHSKNPVYQKDIEKEFKVSKSTVTEILQLMEKNGFIIRKSSKRDGRMKRILPTEKAITIQKEVMDNIRTVEEKLRAGISEEDYRTCLRVLKKMSENLAKEEDYMKGREEMYE